MAYTDSFPRQQLPLTRKNTAWRRQCMDWADSRSAFRWSPVRKSVMKMKINYDLLDGRLHMGDVKAFVNPDGIDADYIPDGIQHYPIMNSKLDLLRGEEGHRQYDWRAVVTNPVAVSEAEEAKQRALLADLSSLVQDTSLGEQSFGGELDRLADYYTWSWQDSRERAANELLRHYEKEYNLPLMFNEGFMDALAVGEELYQCDIVGGEPVVTRLNPMKLHAFRSGYSTRFEDADMIIYEDWWSPAKVIDTYYDQLTKKDIEYIENLPYTLGEGSYDSLGNLDGRRSFVSARMVTDAVAWPGPDGTVGSFSDLLSDGTAPGSELPYDLNGNVRVIRLFWKSRRKILRVKYYDADGAGQFKLRDETYVPDREAGEEAVSLWVNQAWEGVKIGSEVYVNMRPRLVQYNTLSNPSRCHFGIVGSVYSLNEAKPFSMVDRMKPYNYLYDAVYDRLKKLLARSWGRIMQMDLAKKPKGWTFDKWLYYARVAGIAVTDSAKEIEDGPARGRVVGSLNNAQTGVLDAGTGGEIQQYVAILEAIDTQMGDMTGINRQRQGQIANRETVGGVERATLQSSYITDWLFQQHDDVKRRVYACLLETAKVALRGGSKKFSYILSDYSRRVMEIDGNEFAECDYGIVVDGGSGTQELSQKLDTLAQAALQNSTLSFSAIMKIYSTMSLAEKTRIIEKDERATRERAEQQQQQQTEAQRQAQEAALRQRQAEAEAEERRHSEDNETRIAVAEINARAEAERFAIKYGDEDPLGSDDGMRKAELDENARQFDEKMKLERQRLEIERRKAGAQVKAAAARMSTTTKKIN